MLKLSFLPTASALRLILFVCLRTEIKSSFYARTVLLSRAENMCHEYFSLTGTSYPILKQACTDLPFPKFILQLQL